MIHTHVSAGIQPLLTKRPQACLWYLCPLPSFVMYRAIVFAALLAAPSAAQAAPAAPFPVTVSQTKQLPISGAAFYVAVGDEDIAAINVVTSRIVMISGKKTGITCTSS